MIVDFSTILAVKKLIRIKKVSLQAFVGMWAAHNLWLYVFIVLKRKDNNKRNALLKKFVSFGKINSFMRKKMVK